MRPRIACVSLLCIRTSKIVVIEWMVVKSGTDGTDSIYHPNITGIGVSFRPSPKSAVVTPADTHVVQSLELKPIAWPRYLLFCTCREHIFAELVSNLANISGLMAHDSGYSANFWKKS